MAKNEIRLDQIERRFGNSYRRQTLDSGQLPHNAPPGDDDDESQTLNAGFIATVVALFLAVGSGTFYFLNGGLKMDFGESPTLVSSVDGICGKDWREGLKNNDQMHCYLTRDVHRLCDPNEREHLVATIRRYQSDNTVYQANLTAAGLEAGGRAQAMSMQMGMAAAKVTNPKTSHEQRMKHEEKLMRMVDKVNEPVMKLERNTYATSTDQLRDEVAKLISRGYLSEADFGFYVPPLVKDSRARVKAARSACPT